MHPALSFNLAVCCELMPLKWTTKEFSSSAAVGTDLWSTQPTLPAAPVPFFPNKLIEEQSYYIAWCEGEIKRLHKEVSYYKDLYEDLLTRDLQQDFNNLNLCSNNKGKEVILEEDSGEMTNVLFEESKILAAQDDLQL